MESAGVKLRRGNLGIDPPSLYFVYFFWFCLIISDKTPTATMNCENSQRRNKSKERHEGERSNKDRIHLSLVSTGWRVKSGHKSFATTTLWGKVGEGSWTAIKAIKKRLRSLVVEGERDPLINRPEITAGYKIIKVGKTENHTGSPYPRGLRKSTSGTVTSTLRFGEKMLLRGTLPFWHWGKVTGISKQILKHHSLKKNLE